MKLSLFSVSYAGYWGQAKLGLEAFIAKAAELGYEAVMLAGKRPHLSPLDAGPERIERLKAALAQHKLECAVIAGYTDLGPQRAAEVPWLELQIGYVQRLAQIGGELGASAVRVFTAYESEGQVPHAVWSNVVAALREMSDRAAEYGITIAVQNHHDLAVHTDALLELLADVDRPNCKAAFDAWSPALRGEDLYAAARKMAAQTAITTNADYVRLRRFRHRPELVNYEPAEPALVRAVPFGEGFIDYESFFRGLRDGGFDGVASYEMCSPVRGGGSIENLDRYAVRYLSWMREHVIGRGR